MQAAIWRPQDDRKHAWADRQPQWPRVAAAQCHEQPDSNNLPATLDTTAVLTTCTHETIDANVTAERPFRQLVGPSCIAAPPIHSQARRGVPTSKRRQ